MTYRALRALGYAATAALAGVQGSCAQTLGQGGDPDISPWRIVASLLLCAGLAIAGAYILKARSGQMPVFRFAPGRQRRLRVIEQLSLGRDAGISIVSCDEREILILTSPQGCRVIDAALPRADAASEFQRERA